MFLTSVFLCLPSSLLSSLSKSNEKKVSLDGDLKKMSSPWNEKLSFYIAVLKN